MLLLVFRFAASLLLLHSLRLFAYSDIAAICCDSRIVRWQDGIAPYTISVRLAALAASLNCCVGDSLDKVSWRLILRTVSFRNFSWKNRHFPEKIDRRHICSQSSQSSQIIKYGCATPCFFSHYSLLLTTLLPTFRYFSCTFMAIFKDKI